MLTIIYSALIIAVSAFSYVWVTTPGLNEYSLQLFAFGILVFTITKRFKRKHISKTFQHAPYELLILLFCILVFIGTNQEHPGLLYPLISVALFFFVFFSSTFTAIMIGAMMALFLLSTQTFSLTSDYSIILMIPLLVSLFLFTKRQYDVTKKIQTALNIDEEKISTLSQDQNQLESFLKEYLQPKLEVMQHLSQNPSENCEIIVSQLALLDTEISKQLEKLQHKNHSSKSNPD